LKLRQEGPKWLGTCAGYTPLQVAGAKQDHALAYLRGDSVITCVPRWCATLNERWGATTVDIPDGRWKNMLTGEEWTGGSVRLQALLQRFPVALLTIQAE
jgi:(1->4)-alpha-D-glucan 1-alpha-D-glucosylmutase